MNVNAASIDLIDHRSFPKFRLRYFDQPNGAQSRQVGLRLASCNQRAFGGRHFGGGSMKAVAVCRPRGNRAPCKFPPDPHANSLFFSRAHLRAEFGTWLAHLQDVILKSKVHA